MTTRKAIIAGAIYLALCANAFAGHLKCGVSDACQGICCYADIDAKSPKYEREVRQWDKMNALADYAVNACGNHGVSRDDKYLSDSDPDNLWSQSRWDRVMKSETAKMVDELDARHKSMSHEDFCQDLIATIAKDYPNPKTRPVTLPPPKVVP